MHRWILTVRQAKDQEHRIQGIQVEVLNTLGEFLSRFKEASDDMEGERYPAINSVLLWFRKLKARCAPRSRDKSTQHIRSRAKQILNETLKISPHIKSPPSSIWPNKEATEGEATY